MYEEYQDKAVFLFVYIREAHPAFEEQDAEEAGWKKIDDVVYHQPKSFEERRELAEKACDKWDLPVPALIDTLKPSVDSIYRSYPTRIYVINRKGRIMFRGPMGPRGLKPRGAERALRGLLGIEEGEFVTAPDQRRARPGAGG